MDSFVPLALKEKERRKEERATDSSARNGKLVAKLDLNESGKSDDGSATLGLYTSSLCHTKKNTTTKPQSAAKTNCDCQGRKQ